MKKLLLFLFGLVILLVIIIWTWQLDEPETD